MGKLNNRIIAVILLVVWCSVVCAGNWGTQYRSVFIDQEDAGKIAAFILIILISEYGKKLDKGYRCPVYCEVNHKHRMIEYDAKAKQSIDEETDQELDGSVIIADRQQPESSVRPLSDSD